MVRATSRGAIPAGVGEQLSTALSAIPESEKERRRRECAREPFRVTDTHPPTHLRIRVLQDLPATEARVSLAATQEEQVHAELAQDYTRIGHQIDDVPGFANW
jgi:hypothetical protein